jgi:PTH1 family peptidyl-tRNA hydrolase
MMTDQGKVLVIGLGNPGTDYENTYHNAGALALDAIATLLAGGETARWDVHKKLFSSATAGKWIFVKPLTFMNVSGTAVREASRKFNVPAKNIIILHDDSDLPIGTWKISRGQGAAGHHGVESAIAALGANDFTRIRIGIRPANERVRKKAEEFVLRKITKAAAATLGKTFGEIAKTLQAETT